MQRNWSTLRQGVRCACALLFLSLAACASAGGVCKLDLDLHLFPPWQPNPEKFPQALWTGLLLRGDEMDCTGRTWGPAKTWPSIRPAGLTLSKHTDALWLAWVQSQRPTRGVAVGPVAIIRVDYERMTVVSLGALHASDDDVGMQLIEEEGEPTIVRIESGVCPAANGADGDCRRSVRMLPQVGGKLVSAPIVAEGRGSTGAAAAGAIDIGAIDLKRRETVTLRSGLRRTFDLVATLEANDEDGGYTINERVEVRDTDPNARGSVGRLSRQGEGERTLRWNGKVWVTSLPPLWDRIRPTMTER